MNPKHIRTFEIEGTRFHLTDRGDGTLQVTSIHPYDETEYHWALQASKSCWHICRCGHRVKILREHTEVTPEQWNSIFSVNARAPFFLCKAALPYLKESAKPMVINISSVVGFKGYANQSAYSSSKHALAGFTKVFAKEVQPFGIRVHLISPGGVATEMVRQTRPDINPDDLIQPEEICEIVRFLVTRKGKGTIDQFYIRRFNSLAFD